MKRVIWCLFLSLFVIVGVASAQEPKQTVVFDVRVIDLDSTSGGNIETLVRDKAGLDRLIAEGKARIEASLTVRARVNEQSQTRIGQRVPVQTSSLPVLSPVAHSTEPGSQAIALPQIQYENTGLNLDVMPVRVTGDQIEVRFKLELSGVDGATATLTPSFVTRSLSDIIQVRAGEPTVLLAVAQAGQRIGARPNGLRAPRRPALRCCSPLSLQIDFPI